MGFGAEARAGVEDLGRGESSLASGMRWGFGDLEQGVDGAEFRNWDRRGEHEQEHNVWIMSCQTESVDFYKIC